MNLPRPKILWNDSLEEGPAVVAAAHASLAWQLRSAALGLHAVMALPFAAEDFERVPAAALPGRAAALADPPHLVMSESTLGGQVVSLVVGRPGDVVLEHGPGLDPGMPSADGSMRMYICLRDIDLRRAMCAAATASVQCFWQFRTDLHMRQWASGTFHKTVCRVTTGELARAMREPDHVVLHDPLSGEPIGLAFCPRPSWGRCFRYFALFR